MDHKSIITKNITVLYNEIYTRLELVNDPRREFNLLHEEDDQIHAIICIYMIQMYKLFKKHLNMSKYLQYPILIPTKWITNLCNALDRQFMITSDTLVSNEYSLETQIIEFQLYSMTIYDAIEYIFTTNIIEKYHKPVRPYRYHLDKDIIDNMIDCISESTNIKKCSKCKKQKKCVLYHCTHIMCIECTYTIIKTNRMCWVCNANLNKYII